MQTKMINPEILGAHEADPSTEMDDQLRIRMIDIFMGFKQRCKAFPREILFLGLAICDKFLDKARCSCWFLQQNHSEIVQICIACAFLAWKAEGSSQITLRDIIGLDLTNSVTREVLVQNEAKVLKTINFELPSDHTYAAMVREFGGRDQTVRNSRELASECLAFYGKAIKLSNVFVLDSSLGPQIVRRIVDKHSRNSLIIQVCEVIRGRSNKSIACAQVSV